MPTNNNVLGLDVGSARIGVALLADGIMIPRVLPAISNDQTTIDQLRKLVEYKQISKLVVGLPRNLNGDETSQTKAVRDFAITLNSALGLPIIFQDEALTSIAAEQLLRRTGQNYQKGEIDSLAACQILSDYIGQGAE